MTRRPPSRGPSFLAAVLLASPLLAQKPEAPKKAVDPQKAEEAMSQLEEGGHRFEPGPFVGRVLNNDLKTVQLYLDAGMSPDAADDDGTPPIWEAANRGYVDVVRALLAAGAKPDLKDRNGTTALQAATVQRQAECVRVLAAAGANPNLFYKNDGDTPLVRASHVDSPETIYALLEAHADVNRAAEGGQTVLLLEAQKGNPEMVKALLKAGAKVNTPARGGATPLLMAVLGGNGEVVKLLLKAGADSKTNRELLMNSASPEIKKILSGGGAAPAPSKKK